MKKFFLVVLVSAFAGTLSASAESSSEQFSDVNSVLNKELTSLISDTRKLQVAALTDIDQRYPGTGWQTLSLNSKGVTLLSFALSQKKVPKTKEVLHMFDLAKGELANKIKEVIETNGSPEMKNALTEHLKGRAVVNEFRTLVNDILNAESPENSQIKKLEALCDHEEGLPLDQLLADPTTSTSLLASRVGEEILQPNALLIRAICTPSYKDGNRAFLDYLSTVREATNTHYNALAQWEKFKRKHLAKFVKGGLGDLDQTRFDERTMYAQKLVEWSQDAAVSPEAKTLARAILVDLNGFRSHPFSDQALSYGEASVNSLVIDCLFSQDRHNELVALFAPGGMGLLNINDVKQSVRRMFTDRGGMIQVCPSIKIFPHANIVRELCCPEVAAVGNLDQNRVDDYVQSLLKFYAGLCDTCSTENRVLALDEQKRVEFIETVFRNSPLDIDLVPYEKSDTTIVSMGWMLDEGLKADVAAGRTHWQPFATLVAAHRSADNTWIHPQGDAARISGDFVKLVLTYVSTGDQGTFKNIQRFCLDIPYNHILLLGDAQTRRVDIKNIQMGMVPGNQTLAQFFDTLLVDNGELKERISKIHAVLEHNGRVDYNGAQTDDEHGKEVTSKLLVGAMDNADLLELTKTYYAAYPVNLGTIYYNGVPLNAFMRDNEAHLGAVRINTIRGLVGRLAKDTRTPDKNKGEWSSATKFAVTVVVLGLFAAIYAKVKSGQADADTTKAA